MYLYLLKVKPLQRQHSLSFSSPPLNCPDPPIKTNDELGFTYGAHEDPMLLAEYGFTLGGTNFYNHVSVDRELENLFENLEEEGKIKRGVLEDEGYWGYVFSLLFCADCEGSKDTYHTEE